MTDLTPYVYFMPEGSPVEFFDRQSKTWVEQETDEPVSVPCNDMRLDGFWIVGKLDNKPFRIDRCMVLIQYK
ncbi:hypothetical protein [Rosistilla oblonga]|uniref:hypothetical protein n=1 Tax=Rosistilla oblonga TaxID=2527990 RepID=UPI003A9824ED